MEIFDTISYAKGSVIVRMLHSYLGPDLFTSSLKTYLTRHGWSNAKTPDLLSIMDEEFNAQEGQLSVSDFIMPWITQSCYPYILIRQDEENPG